MEDEEIKDTKLRNKSQHERYVFIPSFLTIDHRPRFKLDPLVIKLDVKHNPIRT